MDGAQLFVVTEEMQRAAQGGAKENAAADEQEGSDASDAEEAEQAEAAAETKVAASPAPTPLFSLRTPSGSHHPVLLGDLAPLVELRAYTRPIPLPLLWGMLQHVLTSGSADDAAPTGPMEPGALIALVHALVQHVASKTPHAFPAALWAESSRIHSAKAASGGGAEDASTLHVPSSVSVSLLRLYELCCMEGGGELDQESLIAALILLVRADSTMEQVHLAWSLFNDDNDSEDGNEKEEEPTSAANALALAARESLSIPQFQRFLRATLLPSALALTKRSGSAETVMGWIRATVEFVTTNLCSLFDLAPVGSSFTGASSSAASAEAGPRISFLHLLQFQRSYPNILAFLTVNDTIQARMDKHIALSAAAANGGGSASAAAAPTSMRNPRGPPLSAGTGATGRGPLSPLHEASGEEDEDFGFASRSPLDSSTSADDGRDLFTSDDGGINASAAEGSESAEDEAPVADEPDSPLFSFANSAVPSVSMARSSSLQSQQSDVSTQSEVQPAPAPSRAVSGTGPTKLSGAAAASSALDEFSAAVLVNPSSGAVLSLDPSHIDLLRRVLRPLDDLPVSGLVRHLQQYEEAPRGEIGAAGFKRAVQEMMREQQQKQQHSGTVSAASMAARAQSSVSHLLAIHSLFDVDHSGCADLIELCVGLCTLCGASSVASKLRFAFDLFDSDGDAYLTRNEMMDLLIAMLRPLLPNSERSSHAFLQDLVALHMPALFEGARAFEIDASEGSDDEGAVSSRKARDDRGGRDLMSFREFVGMLALFGSRVPFVAIIQRLLDPSTTALFGPGVGTETAPEPAAGAKQQPSQQAPSPSTAQRQRKQWDLSNRATVIIPRLAQSSDDDEENESDEGDDAAQDSDASRSSFHGSLYSASPLSSYPASPAIQPHPDPSDSCTSDLEAYNASREKRVFQATHRFPSYDEFRATGDASARPRSAAATAAQGQTWIGSLSSDDEEMSPAKEHRFFQHQAALRLASQATQAARGTQASQSQFETWKQGVDQRRVARTGQTAAAVAAKGAQFASRKEAWSAAVPQTHSSPSRPASKRVRLDDSAASAATLQDFHAASKDPRYRLGLFQLFKHQQQARAVQVAAAAGVQPSTQKSAAAPMSARPGTAPAPLSVAASSQDAVDGSAGFAKWASAVTPRGGSESRRLQQERSALGAEDRPSTASAAATVSAQGPSSSPTFQPGRSTLPARIALFTSSAASEAAAAAGLPVRLIFSVEDQTRLQALLKLLASLQPPGYSFLSPAAVVLKRIEPSLQSAGGDSAPIASADAFYRAMHFLLSSTPAGLATPSPHLIDHLIACCFVGFQCEGADGGAAQQGGGAMRIQDFLLALTAWCGSSNSSGGGSSLKSKWAASFQMLLTEGRGRITRPQLTHLFECCVRFLLCVHSGLQDGLGRRGFSELVRRVVESSVAAFFPIADAADRGSISYADFTRVLSRYPTLIPWLQLMHDAQQRATGGRQHSTADAQSHMAHSFDASSSGDDSFAADRSASPLTAASASPDASASDSDYEEQLPAPVSSLVDPASRPILSVDLRPALTAEALGNFPQTVDGAVLAQAVSAEEALLQLSERDIYEFALARSLARDFDSQSLVTAVRAFPCRREGLTQPLLQLLLNHVFGVSIVAHDDDGLAEATRTWLREEFTPKLFLVLEQNGHVQPVDVILTLHALLPATEAAAQGSDENLRAAWELLAAQSSPSQARSQPGCLTSSQVERLLASSLKLLLCFDPNAWGLSAGGEIMVQPDIPLLVTLLSRLATHNLFALANVRLVRSKQAGEAGAVVQLLSFDEFMRVFYAQPTLMPWLEVISGLVQGEEITQQQMLQQEMQRRPSDSSMGSGSEDQEEDASESRAREAYERSRRAQGYMSLSDAEESVYESSAVVSSSPSSPTLSSQESLLLRAALASSSASPPRAQSDGGKREDPRRALFNRWREQTSPQKPAQGRAHQQQQQRQGSDAIRIQITPEPLQQQQRAASASSNGRSPSPLQAALNSRRSYASSSSSASHSSDSSLSTPTRRSGSSTKGGSSKSKSRSKIGPHTLSVDPFSVTLALHQNPSPRALLSAIKVKPLPVFTLPSHAPKLLLCIPLHSERHGSSPASKADSSSVTSPYGESAQSIKVYDADLPAFTFFKAHLRGVDGEELYRRCVGIARSAASNNREPRESDALRVLHCRLTRLEFAAAFKELLSGNAGSAGAAPESTDAVGGLDGPLHSYAISLFRCLDHDSRGVVMLMELALALSLFLKGDHASKLAFAMRLLDAEARGVSESSLAMFYRAIYSLLSALCATHFRMSVPSRPPSPASAPHLRSGGPLSPSSLHSLPHEMMQERLQATARAQSSEMMRLAGLPASATAAGSPTANAASERRIQPSEFLRISAANPHLLSFLHCIDLDETFSPKSKEAAEAAENRQRQSAVQQALNSASGAAHSSPSPRGVGVQQSWAARSPRGTTGTTSGAPLGTLRQAYPSDLPALQSLMARSARGLGGAFYSPKQNQSFEEHVAIPDTHLIEDGTYFVIELPAGASSSGNSSTGGSSELIACGGWSARDKLFRGNDAAAGGIERHLVPGLDPARIRAMFVDPAYARRGLGKRILDACESAARTAGFTRAELMATLPGVPLYRSAGYTLGDPFDIILPDGVALPCRRMSKVLTTQEGGRQNGSGGSGGGANAARAGAASSASPSSRSDLRSPSESEGEEIVVPNTQGRAAAAAAAAAAAQAQSLSSFQQPMGSPTSMPTDLPSMMWSA